MDGEGRGVGVGAHQKKERTNEKDFRRERKKTSSISYIIRPTRAGVKTISHFLFFFLSPKESIKKDTTKTEGR